MSLKSIIFATAMLAAVLIAASGWGGSAVAGEIIVHGFSGPDGTGPYAGLIMDSVGNLYGTTSGGGTGCNGGCGTVFKIAPDGSETVLYSFCSQANCSDGANPKTGVVMDSEGNLYGTTFGGGAGSNAECQGQHGCGIVYKLAANGTLSVLYSFCSQPDCADGWSPSGLIMDGSNNLYGTTSGGGNAANCGESGCGLVFKLAPDGTETVLHSFCELAGCTDGADPYAGVIEDASGNLYGTTVARGSSTNCSGAIAGCGTVFKLAPDGTETVLHSFCTQVNCPDGTGVLGGLILDAKHNLYGTTATGGGTGCAEGNLLGCGTVFKLAPDGTETVLHAFSGTPGDGYYPESAVIMNSKGTIFGTTLDGGKSGFGIVYALKKTGMESVLVNFGNGRHGKNGRSPAGGLVQDAAGYVYGTTLTGGAFGDGLVFKIKE